MSLRRFWAVAHKEFRHVQRDRRLLFLVTVSPAIMLVTFAYLFSFDSSSAQLAIFDRDRSPQSRGLLQAIGEGARGMPVVFPVHPRTAVILRELPAFPGNIHLVDPQPYLEFNWLVKHAKGVITDSGGITEETTVMGVPCLTLRDNTERPETVELGTNELIGTDPAKLAPALARLFDGQWKQGQVPPLWDGRTGERIVATLERLLA